MGDRNRGAGQPVVTLAMFVGVVGAVAAGYGLTIFLFFVTSGLRQATSLPFNVTATLVSAGLLSVLEVLVVFIQAYVFTLLSAVFIGLAIHAHH